MTVEFEAESSDSYSQYRTITASSRVRLTYFTVAASILGIVCTLFFADGPKFLSPGPLISAHGTIDDCSTCHTQQQTGKFSWLARINHDERTDDVKACIKCHEVKGDVTFAHTAQHAYLKANQQKRLNLSSQITQPTSAKVRNIMFPETRLRTHNLRCANCHQDHQGANFDLQAVSNDQCQACHAVQFDSFDGNHPEFDNFPFKRRTRIIYDHARHFSGHFPDTKTRHPETGVPDSCANCHTHEEDRRHMMVRPFQ
ncbi:MAG: cytochrome c3 family protein, partial [Hyphomicrobiales bacterium]|nr:cytochrome c3 family protein [Hyphomicrobiales bacterium]